jgi:hypothetical protein
VFQNISSSGFIANPFSFITSYFGNFSLLPLHYLQQFGLFSSRLVTPSFTYPVWWLCVDMAIKAGILIYLQFYWQKWDRQKLFESGCFNQDYPYAESSEYIAPDHINQNEVCSEFWLATNSLRKTQGLPPLSQSQYQDQTAELNQAKANPPSKTNSIDNNSEAAPLEWELYDTDSELDRQIGLNQPIFEGVLEPITDWISDHSQELYGVFRGFLLPLLTWTLAIILSLIFVLDPRNPVYILFYVLSVTSLFWLNQNITNLMDHLRWKNLRF